jgi:hypothetical protein
MVSAKSISGMLIAMMQSIAVVIAKPLSATYARIEPNIQVTSRTVTIRILLSAVFLSFNSGILTT